MASTQPQSPSRQPAPAPLSVIQEFVNTMDLDEGTDEIVSPARLRDWLSARGLIARSARLDQADVDRAARVREALRQLLLHNNGEPVDPGALAVLNQTARAAAMALHFEPTRAELRPLARGVDGALGQMLNIVHEAMADGTWGRLKACVADDCLWAFYDHSRNHSATWCSMRVCGNREKARRFRSQRAGAKG